jgi:hypothetical protein
MPEIEAPTEHLHETIHEEVHKSEAGHHQAERWTPQVALSSALLAVLAALAALLAGHHVNEATLDQMKASDQFKDKMILAGMRNKVKADDPDTSRRLAASRGDRRCGFRWALRRPGAA